MTAMMQETHIPPQAPPGTGSRTYNRTESGTNRTESGTRTASGTRAVSGIVEMGDGHAFIRTDGYYRGSADAYISGAQIRQYDLRAGDLVDGTAANGTAANGPAANGAAANGTGANGTSKGDRSRSGVLVSVSAVNGLAPDASGKRPRFEELTPIYPTERLRLEDGSSSPTARIIDLIAPIGKGTRGLIVSPPKAGKTTILKTIAGAISRSHPEVHLMMLLVGERPEEVTDLRRSVQGEVIYSTFDQSAQDHTRVAELAIERAKRLVEAGRDVVVLLDSLTRLGRAYNMVAPASSRTLAGGVAASALQPPRKFLGAARNIEDGGSLTILSTVLVDTGSRMDDVLFEEFKGTGNMELRLRRELAEKRLYPAVDAMPSGTRRDELIMAPLEYQAVAKLRRALGALDPQQATELLLDKTRDTDSNAEFLSQIQR
jgi:transcription termination factor Rho